MDLGLIEFTGRINHKEGYLCWKLGENKIQFWHTLTEGLPGQKLITKDTKIVIEFQDQPNNLGMISTPAGALEEGEDPLRGAKRELLEETGYTSEDWLMWKMVTPHTRMQSTIHYFMARDCTKTSTQNLDAGEKIRIELVDFDQFLGLAESDDFRDWVLGRYIMQLRLHPDKLSAFRQLLGL